MKQQEMEMLYAENNMTHLLDNYISDEYMDYLIQRLKIVMVADSEKPFKRECIDLIIKNCNPRKVFKKMITPFILKDKVILQEIVSKVFPIFGNATTKHRQGVCVDCFLTALLDGNYFSITQTSEEYFVTTIIDFTSLRTAAQNMGFVLPSIEPLEPVDNRHIGYKTFSESIICGSKNNPLDYEKCFSHINRENRTKLCWDDRVLKLSPLTFDPTAKWRGDHWETVEEINNRFKQFELLKQSIPDKVSKLDGNEFYIAHKYDKRGRCYCKAHEFNYMGDKGVKASITLAEKVLIKDTRK